MRKELGHRDRDCICNGMSILIEQEFSKQTSGRYSMDKIAEAGLTTVEGEKVSVPA